MNSARSILRRQCWSSYRACLRRYREEAQVTEQQYRNELIRSTSSFTRQDSKGIDGQAAISRSSKSH